MFEILYRTVQTVVAFGSLNFWITEHAWFNLDLISPIHHTREPSQLFSQFDSDEVKWYEVFITSIKCWWLGTNGRIFIIFVSPYVIRGFWKWHGLLRMYLCSRSLKKQLDLHYFWHESLRQAPIDFFLEGEDDEEVFGLNVFLGFYFSHISYHISYRRHIVFHHWPFVCDLSFMISDFCTLYSLTVS